MEEEYILQSKWGVRWFKRIAMILQIPQIEENWLNHPVKEIKCADHDYNKDFRVFHQILLQQIIPVIKHIPHGIQEFEKTRTIPRLDWLALHSNQGDKIPPIRSNAKQEALDYVLQTLKQSPIAPWKDAEHQPPQDLDQKVAVLQNYIREQLQNAHQLNAPQLWYLIIKLVG